MAAEMLEGGGKARAGGDLRRPEWSSALSAWSVRRVFDDVERRAQCA